MSSQHAREVGSGERFAFGDNWSRFLAKVDEDRIQKAECSLQEMLEISRFDGRSFLDVGSGSGLFSLAARRLGAQVLSFDYDPQSVACTMELKNRYFPNDPQWRVENGSALDNDYLNSLGKWDFVYSWGVLHHTGAMWRALENISVLPVTGGRLFIAIYNDQGTWSKRWHTLKHTYNKLPKLARPLFASCVMGSREFRFFLGATLRGRPMAYFDTVLNYSKHSPRGMSYWYDLIDWIGGYPFEVAMPEEIFSFYRTRNFTLRQLRTTRGSLGCNEFVFEKA
jgi:2-polyprenyl-3-methyl-5-hydroxy-6-metoxy-1,4-benzoquinol methylase